MRHSKSLNKGASTDHQCIRYTRSLRICIRDNSSENGEQSRRMRCLKTAPQNIFLTVRKMGHLKSKKFFRDFKKSIENPVLRVEGGFCMINYTAIITTASVISSLVVIVSSVIAVYRWFQRQAEQDKEINDIKDEQAVLTYGVLACLKGLKEQGCDGPVTDAINKIEKHINQAAHK